MSPGACLPPAAAPSSALRGYGCVGFLLGRGGGIWIAAVAVAAAAPEPLQLPDDSLVTCRARGESGVRKIRGW